MSMWEKKKKKKISVSRHELFFLKLEVRIFRYD